MTARSARRDDHWRAEIERLDALLQSARAKTAEVFGEAPSEFSGRALLRRQRATRKAIEEALRGSQNPRDAREIAFHLCEWFEEAAFLVALQLDAKRFSQAEIKAGVSEVLANVLDHVWEAARVAGFPLPCLEGDTPHHDDDEDT